MNSKTNYLRIYYHSFSKCRFEQISQTWF